MASDTAVRAYANSLVDALRHFAAQSGRSSAQYKIFARCRTPNDVYIILYVDALGWPVPKIMDDVEEAIGGIAAPDPASKAIVAVEKLEHESSASYLKFLDFEERV